MYCVERTAVKSGANSTLSSGKFTIDSNTIASSVLFLNFSLKFLLNSGVSII